MLRIYFGQPEVNDEASPGVRVIEEVAGLDVSVVDAKLFEIPEPEQELIDIVADLLEGESVEEGLSGGRRTMKGLNLKYSMTIWVMSW